MSVSRPQTTQRTMAKGTWRQHSGVTFSQDLFDFKPPKQRRSNYSFDLELGDHDGGFIRYNAKRSKLKVFIDSDDSGYFNKGDKLIGKGKVTAGFKGESELLEHDEVGVVKSDSVNYCHELGGIDPCFAPMYRTELEFMNANGELVAQINANPLFLFSD